VCLFEGVDVEAMNVEAMNVEGMEDMISYGERSKQFGNLARIIVFCLVAVAGSSFAQSQRPDRLQLNDNIPLTYIVKKGDTLWDISAIYLSEPWRWPELWDSNPQVDNPHLIYPGDVLTLRWENGRPRLVRGDVQDVRLSPQIRSESINQAIAPIPRDQIEPFLRGNRIVMPEDYEAAPYVIAGDAKRLISALGDRIYARGEMDLAEQTYGLLREGQLVVDPVTDEVLGLQVADIGTATLLSGLASDPSAGAVKTLEVTRVTEEVRISDRLFPQLQGVVDAFFYPQAPAVSIENAFMVAVDRGVSQIGALDIVTINRGAREGLRRGDVLAIYQTGDVVKDPIEGDWVELPDVRAGVVMVFAVYEKASYALVLSASRPLAVGDKVKNP
jgi:hypothetical protein